MQAPGTAAGVAPQSGGAAWLRAPDGVVCGMDAPGSRLLGFQTSMHCVSYFVSRGYWVYTFRPPHLPHVFVCPPSLNGGFDPARELTHVAGYLYVDMRALPEFLVRHGLTSADRLLNELCGVDMPGSWTLAVRYQEAVERALGCVLIRGPCSAPESPFRWHFLLSRQALGRLFAWSRGSVAY